MRALDRLPRRRASRSVHPAIALMVSLVVAIVAATAVSPVAEADPPPSHLGGWTETDPFHGEAADPFTITYWFIGIEGPCPFSVARFIWDFDTTIGTATMNATTCSATLAVPSAPTDEVANHNVNAEGCNISSGDITCDGSTNAGTMYMVDPTPTISVTPTSGQAGEPFSVTYTVPDPGCFYTDTQFYWDGSPMGSPVAMTGCSSTLDLPGAPAPNEPGSHTIAAEACDGDVCETATRKTVTYTIVAAPSPTITVDPTQGLANQNFGLRYTVFELPCPYPSAQFYWDGSPLGSPVDLDSNCSAPWFEEVAPSPNGIGAHTVAAEGCDGPCDPASRAEVTYTILAPPTLVLTPTSGVVDAPFRATYHINDGSCSLWEARFFWDDAPVADVLLDDTCTAVLDFPVAPLPNDVGSHMVAAETCIDGCDARTRASASYEVLPAPPPSLTADPTSGLPGDPFTITYEFGLRTCSFSSVAFSWDGTPIGSVPMDSGCTATVTLESAPSPATLGVHSLAGVPCASTFCDDASRASTTYTVVAPPADPTISVDPTAGLANQAFGIRFSTNQSPCPYTSAQFSWDGAPLGSPVLLDPTCSTVLFVDEAPTPNGPGTHEIGAQACDETCAPATSATTTYTILAPPSLVLSPTSGLSGAGFTATYHVNDGSCTLWQARFYWDGAAVSPDVDLGTCTAVFDFPAAPAPNDVGPHTVAADTCIDGCDERTRATATYVVVAPPPPPTPTLTLSPASGRAGDPFRATFATNGSGCGYTHAFFAWDGAVVGDPVGLGRTCTAVLDLPGAPAPNGAGSHAMMAIACEASSCDPATLARATYVVTAPPAVTPTPTPRPTPTASAEPPARPEPSAEPSPSTDPSIEPSIDPVPSEPPGPSPTGEVAEATDRPEPATTPLPGAVIPPGTPPGTNPYVPAIVAYIGGPDAGAIDPAVIATNLLLTLLLVFLFMLTSEIFNSTMDANRDTVHGWWARLLRGPMAFMGALTISGQGLDRLSGSGRLGSIARVLAVLVLLGLIYGFLSPDFGPNAQSLILVVSLVVGLGFLTFFSEGSATRLATSRYRADASIKLYGTAILVAIIAVIISRSVDFQPGLLYGFVASAVIVAPIALAKRDDATLVLVPAFGLLVVSVLAWLLLGPVREIAADGAPLPALTETILGMIVIGGLEGLFIMMLPLTFMDGATVMRWSRVAWVLVFGTVTFLWWQLLLNQDDAYAAALEQTNVRVVFFVLGVFMVTTGLVWAYFRFRSGPAEAEA